MKAIEINSLDETHYLPVKENIRIYKFGYLNCKTP